MILQLSHFYFMKDLEKICNANNLMKAYNLSKKGVSWKESVQRYEIDILANIYKTQKAIREGTYKSKDMYEFLLYERGRIRRIQSQHISDRVVQRSLNDNVLLPVVRPKLIYDNGASLTGRGIDFARNRFRVHLQRAYRKYNGQGYVLFIDFSKYFDNIRHEEALNQFSKLITSDELAFITERFKDFEIDVSDLSDEDFEKCLDVQFNATKYIKPANSSRTKYMRKCIGIGNQISQITGIFYPHEIDNYCKVVKGYKYYGRYMDDTYIMFNDKQELLNTLEYIKNVCSKLGIYINPKKTQIHKIDDWLTFLKINFKCLSSGKVIRKVHNSTIRRIRSKLRKYKRLIEKGRMTFQDVLECYRSWRGNYRKFDSGYKILSTDKLFKELFAVYYEKDVKLW